MKPKKPSDFSQASIYDLLNLGTDYSDRIISFADRYAHWRRINSIIKHFHREAKKAKRQNFNTLDIGCGKGYIDFKLKESVNKNCHLRVIGIDNYKPAIDFANTRKEFLNRGDCHFELMDACSLKFENDFFDIIICSEMLEHFKEPQRAINEINRVLKKGGRLILTTRFVYPLHDVPYDYFRYTKYGLRELFKDWKIDVLESESESLESIAILLQRLIFQINYKFNKFIKVILLVQVQFFLFLNRFVSKEFGDIKKETIEKDIMSSGYYLVCRKR